MAVIVSKQFASNFEVVAAYWKEMGDTPEEIAELKAAIRIDLDDGAGFMRDEQHRIDDPAVRRKLWEDYFQAVADEIRAGESAVGRSASAITARIVKNNLTMKKAWSA